MTVRIKIILTAMISIKYYPTLIFIILFHVSTLTSANTIDPELSDAIENINTLWEMYSLDEAVSQLNLTAPKFVKVYGKRSTNTVISYPYQVKYILILVTIKNYAQL